jgi:hypothetical protein
MLTIYMTEPGDDRKSPMPLFHADVLSYGRQLSFPRDRNSFTHLVCPWRHHGDGDLFAGTVDLSAKKITDQLERT